MLEKLIAVRKHGGEKYKIFVILPEYDGETGIFGIEEIPVQKLKHLKIVSVILIMFFLITDTAEHTH